jgi:hypothetical protein
VVQPGKIDFILLKTQDMSTGLELEQATSGALQWGVILKSGNLRF